MTGGKASIDLNSEGLSTGTYFIMVQTDNQIQMVNYYLTNNLTKDPCGAAPNFSYETQVDNVTDNTIELGRRSMTVDGDNLWIIYAQGPKNDQQVMVRHSPNGGVSFDSPVQITDATAPTFRHSPSIARGSNGSLYAGWIDGRTGVGVPMVDSSVDGSTWGTDIDLYDFETGSLLPDNAPIGPVIEADQSGRVHTSWLDQRSGIGDFHLYYTYSDDHGVTWHPAEKVDDSATSIFGSDESWDMSTDPVGDAIAAWADDRHVTIPPLSNRDIFFDLRPKAGSFGTDHMVNLPTLNVVQDHPAVSWDGVDGYYVAWVDGRDQTSLGGPNPDNTWEIFFAHSTNGGSTWIDETKVPVESPGYISYKDLNLRMQVSPWGNPYVAYGFNQTNIDVSRSCDLGITWQTPITAYTVPASCYFYYLSLALRTDGAAFLTYTDTRVNPGPDHPYVNLFMKRSD